MDFRRIPFKFSTTDPAERQSELMRRFGVSSEDMLIENRNEPFVDARSSPRLQHRVPGFDESYPAKVNHPTCGQNVDSLESEPKVRVVPIQVEGETGLRHRTQSGDRSVPTAPASNHTDEHVRQRTNSGSYVPRFNSGMRSGFTSSRSPFFNREPEQTESSSSPKSSKRVCHIPIHVEGRSGGKLSQSKSVPSQGNISRSSVPKMGNGPCVSKSPSEPSAAEPKLDLCKKFDINVSLKKVVAILREFKAFEESVDKFSGMQGDKQYRYLDEMLTRCMIKLDDIETYGNEEVRKARKAAVKQVQDAINVLDSKVQPKSEGSQPVNVSADVDEKENKAPDESAVKDEAMVGVLGNECPGDLPSQNGEHESKALEISLGSDEMETQSIEKTMEGSMLQEIEICESGKAVLDNEEVMETEPGLTHEVSGGQQLKREQSVDGNKDATSLHNPEIISGADVKCELNAKAYAVTNGESIAETGELHGSGNTVAEFNSQGVDSLEEHLQMSKSSSKMNNVEMKNSKTECRMNNVVQVSTEI